MSIGAIKNYGAMMTTTAKSGKVNANQTGMDAAKPTWDGKKAYTYLEDCNQAGLEYGEKAKAYYTGKTAVDGELSVEELKKQIKDWFPQYTLTDREPKDVTKGKFYLYIDDSQLQKMAKDPAYRGKVYGLMDREYATGQEWTMTYSDGKNVTEHLTGSVFSLCEANRKYAGADGIPYRGSCTSDHPFSSSESHVQVRSQSFLYNNLDPAKSAANSRKIAATAAKEKLEKKRAEKKQTAKKAAKKAEEKKAENKKAARKAEEKQEAKRMEEKQAEEVEEGEFFYEAFDQRA